jgi:hypothetical protein
MLIRRSQRAPKPVTIWEEKKAPSAAFDPNKQLKRLEVGQKPRSNLSQLGLFQKVRNSIMTDFLSFLFTIHHSIYEEDPQNR